jgi:hypothetical protein
MGLENYYSLAQVLKFLNGVLLTLKIRSFFKEFSLTLKLSIQMELNGLVLPNQPKDCYIGDMWIQISIVKISDNRLNFIKKL